MEFGLDTQFVRLIADFRKRNYKATQKALELCGDAFAKRIRKESPSDLGDFRMGWRVKMYPGSAYVWNEVLTKNRIPLSNILNATPKHKGFINDSWSRHKEEIYSIFISTYERIIKNNNY